MSYARVVSLLLFHLFILVNGERLSERMYDNLNGAACFRRLNGTHSIGCTSSFSGSVGVLHLLQHEDDLRFLLDTPPAPPYVVIVPPRLFTRKIIMQLKANAGVINGILLINNRTELEEFSQESQCPNEWGGLTTDQSCSLRNETTWNPPGTDLMNENYPFPIYYVSDATEVQKAIDCFEKFNNFDLENQHTRALCSVQVKTLMTASGTSKSCLARTSNTINLAATRFCDSLQGQNVYATLFERPTTTDERKPDPTEKFILVSARLDTVTMFDGLYGGAMDSLVSLVTVLGAAQFLNSVLPEPLAGDSKRNILFMFFNGESLDYIGSQRFLYDLNKNMFPDERSQRNTLSLENIEFMIDIGTLDDLHNVKIYYPEEFPLATKFLAHWNAYSQTYKLNVDAEQMITMNLPPFSAQTFWRENLSFPAVIMTSAPQNRYFHSVFDDASNLNFTYMNRSGDYSKLEPLPLNPTEDSIQYRIRNFATLLGMNLYDLVTKSNYTEKNVVNVGLIDEILFCFLITSNCKFFKALTDESADKLPDRVPARYIGVNTGLEGTLWTYQAVGYLLGKKTEKTKEECTQRPFYWYTGIDSRGECLLTTNNFSVARSPAFLDDNYDWNSHKYSTWTESTWSVLSARIFLQPSRTHNALTLATGIVMFVISVVLVYLIKSRADILFADSVSTTPISQPVNC